MQHDCPPPVNTHNITQLAAVANLFSTENVMFRGERTVYVKLVCSARRLQQHLLIHSVGCPRGRQHYISKMEKMSKDMTAEIISCRKKNCKWKTCSLYDAQQGFLSSMSLTLFISQMCIQMLEQICNFIVWDKIFPSRNC